jgi:hypothetical protein
MDSSQKLSKNPKHYNKSLLADLTIKMIKVF